MVKNRMVNINLEFYSNLYIFEKFYPYKKNLQKKLLIFQTHRVVLGCLLSITRGHEIMFQKYEACHYEEQ